MRNADEILGDFIGKIHDMLQELQITRQVL